MKKLFSVLLVAAIVLSLCVVSISAENSSNPNLPTVEKSYSVKAGDIIQYTVYMNINSNNKVCSLDATTFYSDNLQFIPDLDKYGDNNLDKMFPILSIATVTNLNGVNGGIIYNYSSAQNGRRFNEDDCVLATFTFLAKEDGTATISTVMKCLAMMDSDSNMVVIVDQDLGLVKQNNFTTTNTIKKTGTAKMYGDVNGDGKISLGGDAVYIQKHLAQQDLTNFDETVADVNGDGKITLGGDAVNIQKYLAQQDLPDNIVVGEYIIP
ncbi:MAG: hypothetical protein E7513_03705 [Ruminococcaceae bacterium]|nr:hypothetical protein [Oscillospiraceae bacterium]